MKKISTGVLSNGLRWYGQYDSTSSGFLCGVGVRIGSAFDPVGKSGLAHLTEHLVFRESEKYSLEDTYFYCTKLMGGFGNMLISTDDTSMSFFSPLIRTHRNMKAAFDVIADIVKNPKFDSRAVNTELAAVLNEHYKREADDFETSLSLKILETTLGVAQNRPITIREIPDEIQRLTLGDVRKFIRRYFVPKNMFVVMLGPQIHEVTECVQAYFGDWGGSTSPLFDTDPLPFVPLKTIQSYENTSSETSQYHITIATPTEPSTSSDTWALEVLAEVLGNRLEWKLREGNSDIHEGIYHPSVGNNTNRLYGVFSASTYSLSKDYIRFCEETILAEMRSLCETLTSQREFDMGFHAIFESYANAFRNVPEALAEHILYAACNGDEKVLHLNNSLNLVKKVTRKKLRAVAAKYFSNEYARISISPTTHP